MKKSLYSLAMVFVFALLLVDSHGYGEGYKASRSLFPFKVGQTFTFDVKDGVGSTWEYKTVASGTARISLNGQKYYIIESLGYESPEDFNMALVRSVSKKVYIYSGSGEETLVLQNAPVGTTWTYEDSDGRTIERTIEAIETVTVPAGTFEGCLKFFHKCISCNPPVEFTREWSKPGFGMVKEIDYYTDNPPKTKELKSRTK